MHSGSHSLQVVRYGEPKLDFGLDGLTGDEGDGSDGAEEAEALGNSRYIAKYVAHMRNTKIENRRSRVVENAYYDTSD
jgi:hypothetical protein